MKNYILSAFADEHAESLAAQIDGMHTLGIRMIEPRFFGGKNVSEMPPSEVKAIADALKAGGLSVSALGSPIGKVSLDCDMESYLDCVKHILENACILGADRVRMFSFYLGERAAEDCQSEVIERLGRILSLAKEYSLTLCHENEAGIFGDSPERCRILLDAFQGELSAVFDMGNFVLGGYDAMDAFQLLRPYIRYFHIKDARFSGEIVPPGAGEARIADILALYAADMTADTVVTLEPHLVNFAGLSTIAGGALQLPEYSSAAEAFEDAVHRIKTILTRCNA